jgi:APOBEC-like N-terminal domain
MTLLESLQRARQLTTPAEVWCITRFDRSDATLEIYWSEKDTHNPAAVISSTPSGGGGLRPYGGSAAHAECVMARAFPQAVTTYGRAPARVEIFLSRSPCAVSAAFTFGGITFPTGCAAKLATLIAHNPNVGFWDIRYDTIYWGNPVHQPNPESDILAGSASGLESLAALHNVSIHQFNALDVVP